MSSGNFVRSRYVMDGGQIVPIQVQPETIALTVEGTANAATTDAVTLSVSAKARKGNTEYGIGARNITISWEGSPPAGYADENLTIPILQPTVFDGINVSDTANYLGTACVVVSKKSEQLR